MRCEAERVKYMCTVGVDLIESELESNQSTMSVWLKDDSIAVSCVMSDSDKPLVSRATAIIYAIYPSRTSSTCCYPR